MVSIHVLATPMIGLARSASVKPIAFSMARAGARSRPCVMVWLLSFMAEFIVYRSLAAERLYREIFFFQRDIVFQLLGLEDGPAVAAKVGHFHGPRGEDALHLGDIGGVQLADHLLLRKVFVLHGDVVVLPDPHARERVLR